MDATDKELEAAIALSGERMLHWFRFSHLKEPLATVSSRFAWLAMQMVDGVAAGPERTAGLRKLLEAKDCIVRAVLRPGG